MENPNAGVTLRRHNSLPTRSRRTEKFDLGRGHKSNPYIGWFRHSPPATLNCRYTFAKHSQQRQYYETTWSLSPKNGIYPCSVGASQFKSSPYVGWFRHAPSKQELQCLTRRIFPETYDFLRALLKLLSEQQKHNACGNSEATRILRLADLLNGHLKGGAGGSHKRSSTVKVLSRLAYWLLMPFDPPSLEPYKADDIESTSVACEDEDEYDEEEKIEETSSTSSLSARSTSISVSSQAEEYYAHQATKELELDPEHVEEEARGQDRMDYVITQMDIVRMNRNASRHLDVQSIRQLPTITYYQEQQPPQERQQPPKTARQSDNWSWMMVGRGDLDVSESSCAEESDRDQGDVCVICLEHFANGDRLRVLPCGHSFHVGCIDRWLSGSHSFQNCDTTGCPTCKKRPQEVAGGVGELSSRSPSPNATAVEQELLPAMDGSVPSWAFARLGSVLAEKSSHF